MKRLSVVWSVAIAALLTASTSGKWNNKAISRRVRVQPNVVEETILYSVNKVTGPDSGKYEIVLEDFANIGSLNVEVNGELAHVVSVNSNDREKRMAIESPKLESEKTNTIKVSIVRGNQLVPFPAETFEFDNQLVVLNLNTVVSSPYETDTEKTEIMVGSGSGGKAMVSASPSQLLSSSDTSSGMKLTTGDIDSNKRKEIVKSGSLSTIRLHFAHPSALAHLGHVKKTVEVSHWGAAISVKEEVELVNRGASLKGEFNRVPFIHLKYSGAGKSPFPIGHTLMSVDAIVPQDAFNIHYRDVIGNISTSHAKREAGHTVVEIQPRFPMLGGWKTEFELSYDIPATASKRLLQSVSSDEYVVWVPVEHAIKNVFADKMELEVILPAGATDVRVSDQGGSISLTSSKKSTTVISNTKKGWMVAPWQSGKTSVKINVGPTYGKPQTLAIKYSLSRWDSYLSPFLITLYVFVFFAAFILARRIRLETADDKELREEDDQTADYDICKEIEDSFTDMCRANAELIDSVAASSSGNKDELNELKKVYLETYEQVFTRVEKLCSDFITEKNKVDRTVRILMNLRNQKETAVAIVDNAIGGKDVLSSAGIKLIEIENEMNSLVGRVMTGTETPPPSPSGGGGADQGTTRRRGKGTSSGTASK